MPRSPPPPGYTRPVAFKGWPRKCIDPPPKPLLDATAADRFMRAFQTVIARALRANNEVSINEIGRFYVQLNRAGTLEPNGANTASTFRNVRTGEPAARKNGYVIKFETAFVLRNRG